MLFKVFTVLVFSLMFCLPAAASEKDFFQNFDTNYDESITLEQFLKYIATVPQITGTLQEEDWKQNARIIFKVYDVNDNGRLNRKQFESLKNQIFDQKSLKNKSNKEGKQL